MVVWMLLCVMCELLDGWDLNDLWSWFIVLKSVLVGLLGLLKLCLKRLLLVLLFLLNGLDGNVLFMMIF